MCDHCGCREFGAIAELTAEHEEILSLAWCVAEHDGDDGAVRLALARLRVLLDTHVVKEETALYPLLLEKGDLDVETSTALEDEHRTLHAALAVGPFDRRSYYALAAHIEQEEMELFPAAMFAFDDDEWDEMETVHRRAGGTARLHVTLGVEHGAEERDLRVLWTSDHAMRGSTSKVPGL